MIKLMGLFLLAIFRSSVTESDYVSEMRRRDQVNKIWNEIIKCLM